MWREPPAYAVSADLDSDRILSVLRMKVRLRVVGVEHSNDDSEKAGDLRHRRNVVRDGVPTVSHSFRRFTVARTHSIVERLRRPIGAVWPGNGSPIQSDLREQCRIAQRLEYFAIQFAREVDLTIQPVAEFQPQDMAADVKNTSDANQVEVEHR